ncbi:hypothetical protein [Haloarchaeobius sp. TZWSO28]|uniref:hypothetical protein n=1 Tax=Haloarchaeobius sp. TZWSO28 TaxID=3446119 RepID=UPI003EBA413D
MPGQKASEDGQEGNRTIPRRRILSSGLAGLGALGMAGLTHAETPGKPDEELVDPSEFDADITSTSGAVTDTETYVGPGSTNGPTITAESMDGPTVGTEAIATLSEEVYVTTIPYSVPEIGGTDITLTFDATFGFTEVGVSVGICFDGFCLELIGASISYSNAEICADIRGKLKSIPLQVEGCFTFAPSLDPVGLEVGASVGVCLDLPKMEEIYERDGWEWTRRFLCVSEDVSVTL